MLADTDKTENSENNSTPERPSEMEYQTQRVAALEEASQPVNPQVTELLSSIEALKEDVMKMKETINELHSKNALLTKENEDMLIKLSNMNEIMNQLEGDTLSVRRGQRQIESQLYFMRDKIEKINNSYENTYYSDEDDEEDDESTYEKLEKIEEKQKVFETAVENKMKKLINTVNELEEEIKAKNLVISELAQFPNEGLMEAVMNLGNKINYPLQLTDISYCIRKPIEGNEKVGKVIVKFVREKTRKEFSLLLSQQKLNLKEREVTEMTTQTAILLQKAMNLKTTRRYQFVWCEDNKVYIQANKSTPKIHIKSENDIPQKKNRNRRY